MRTELELFIVSRVFSNEDKLNKLLEDLELYLLNSNEHEDEENIFYYGKLVKECKEKIKENTKMFGWNNAL